MWTVSVQLQQCTPGLPSSKLASTVPSLRLVEAVPTLHEADQKNKGGTERSTDTAIITS
jgi:hypothetical protein